jgi:hypothetical protein
MVAYFSAKLQPAFKVSGNLLDAVMVLTRPYTLIANFVC